MTRKSRNAKLPPGCRLRLQQLRLKFFFSCWLFLIIEMLKNNFQENLPPFFYTLKARRMSNYLKREKLLCTGHHDYRITRTVQYK